VQHELRESREVGCDDAQQVVVGAGHRVALEHLGQQLHRAVEVLVLRFAVPFERDARVGDHGEPEALRAQQRHAAVDEPGFFETLDAAADLRGGQVHALAERRVGRAAVALQCVEQLQVGAIERDHRSQVSEASVDARFMRTLPDLPRHTRETCAE